MSKDLYSILGVSKTASAKDLQKAYRALARKLHPDVNKDNSKAEKRFKEVSAAYDVLQDSEKRKLYDEFGAQSLEAGFNAEQARAYKSFTGAGGRGRRSSGGYGPSGMRFEGAQDISGFGDVFGDLFSQFGGKTSGFTEKVRKHAAPKPVEQALPVSFRDAILGGQVEIVLGSGSVKKNLKVKIPPGSDNGTKIRLGGKKTGVGVDVILVLKVNAHPYLKRKDDNIVIDLPVKLSELVLGSKVAVPTLNGKVMVTIPAGTPAGKSLRVKGKGVPHKKRGKGDLLVRLQLVAPDKISDETKRLAAELDNFYSKDPRQGL